MAKHFKRIVVITKDGIVGSFKDVREASERIGVTASRIYDVINHGTPLYRDKARFFLDYELGVEE